MKKILFITLSLSLTINCIGQLIISSNTTWSGSLFLSQKVIVNQGVTLTVEPATIISIGYLDANGDNIGDVEIEVLGKLVIKGNKVCAPVVFGPFTTSTNKKYWKGIKINSNVVNDSIFGVNIYNAETPFNILSNTTIRDSKIRLFDNIGVNFTPTNSNIQLSLQELSIKKGLTAINQSSTSSILKADWIEIDSCINGIIGNTGTLELKSSRIYNSTRLGVSFNDGSMTINNSKIKKNYAFGVFNSSGNLNIKNCEIDSNILGGILVSGLGTNLIQYSNIKYNKGAQIEISDYKFNLSQSGPMTSPYDGNPTITVNNNNILGDTLSTIADTAKLFYLDYGNPGCGFDGGNLNFCVNSLDPWVCFPTVLGRLNSCYLNLQYIVSGVPNTAQLIFKDVTTSFWASPTTNIYTFNNWINTTPTYSRNKCFQTVVNGNYTSSCSCGESLARLKVKINAYQLRAEYLFGGDLIFNNIRTAVSPQFNFTSNNFGQPILSNFFFDQSNQCINYSNYTINNIPNSGLQYGQQLLNTSISNLVYLVTTGNSDTICNSNNLLTVPQVANATYNWYLNGNLFTISSSNIFLPPASGAWNCIVNSQNCNYTSTVKNIVVSSGPTINISGSQTICQGQSTTLTASGANSYLWSNGSITPSITINPTNSLNMNVTGLLNGCTTTISLPITVNILPNITMNPYPSAIICSGSTLTLTASGGIAYTWNTGAITSLISISTPGVYSVTGTDNNGCINTSPNTTVVISNNVPITPIITLNGPAVFCQGGSVILTSSSATGNTWSNGATTQSITVTNSGSYTVTLSNGTCSASSIPTIITVNNIPTTPTITANGATTFCAGGYVTLTSSSATGNTWSNGATSQSINASTSGLYSTHITSSGCASLPSNTIQVSAIANPNNSVTPSGPTSFCQGNSVTLNAILESGNTYQWYNNGLLIPSATSNMYNASSNGNYTVFISSSNCSSTSSPLLVTVNSIPAAPIISASGNTTICQGGNVTLNANLSNVVWSNNATTTSITVYQSGNYIAQAINNGCTSQPSNQISIVVNPLPQIPVITSSGPTTFCSGASVTLISSSSIGNSWSTNQITPSITVSNSGNYTVMVTDLNGCSSVSLPLAVIVNSTPTAPVISASGPTTFCSGGSLTLLSNNPNGNLWSNAAASQSIIVNSSGTYFVSVTENGCTSLASNSITVTVNTTPAQPIISANGPTTFCSGNSVVLTSSSPNGNIWNNGQITQSITAINSGNYSLQVSNNGCTNNSNTIIITVNPVPSAPIINTSGPTSFCQGSNVTLTTNYASGVTWTSSNGSQFSVPTLIVQSNQTAINATVTVNGCTSAPSQTISTTVLPIGTPSFTQVAPICAGSTLTLPSVSNNGYSGSWSPAINNITTTTYTFNPASGECATPQTMTVAVNSLPQVSLSTFPAVCDTLTNVVLSGGTPLGGTYTGTSVTSNTFNPSVGIGTYPITYTYTNGSGCSANANQNLTVISCNTSDITDLSTQLIHIYPNPSRDVLFINSEIELFSSFELIDNQGRIVLSDKLKGNQTSVNLEAIAPGNYYLKIEERNILVKVVKQ
jgi:hypothetical protein